MSRKRLQSKALPTAPRARTGFTLIEMLAVMAIIGMLLGIVTPRLQQLLKSIRVTEAINDITVIQQDVIAFSAVYDSLPQNLEAVGRGGMVDPWGHPYRYLAMTYDKNGNPSAGVRMDRALHPLNSDFDLYSMGEDGVTALPLTAKASQDDIIRANDGGFVGLARLY